MLYDFDLGLIIPLGEEFDAAREVLAFDEPIPEAGHYLYPFSVPGSPVRGVAVVLFEMGLAASAVVGTRLLGLADIGVLALVGVAGALDSDLRLGDVVIASSVEEYLYGAKATVKLTGDGFGFERGGWSWRAAHQAVSYADNFRYLQDSGPFNSWRQRARGRRDTGLESGVPELARELPDYAVGAVATGDVVSAAGSFAAWLRRQNRFMQAIEMEAGGAARAVYHDGMADLVVIRGITDFADQRKNELDSAATAGRRGGAWRRYAAVNAFDLLATMVSLPQFPWPRPASRPRRSAFPGGHAGDVDRLQPESVHRGSRLTPAASASAADPGFPSQAGALTQLQASNLAPAQADAAVFFDDFSNPGLARYYEIIPGIGTVNRREGGLHYEITRAPDGPSDASDCLVIDSLGRPHSPTTRVVFRFSGTDWTLEACVEYNFPLMRNGRGAYLWLIPGDVSDGYEESIALIRYADLDPGSHSLSLDAYDPAMGSACAELARPPAARYWFRLTRAGSSLRVWLSDDGHAFRQVDERAVRPEVASHRLVMNSQSFAGGASFALRSLRLAGAQPHPAPAKPPAFVIAGSVVPAVSAGDILAAMQAGRDIDIRGCAITGALDLAAITSPITCGITMVDCSLIGLTATKPVSLTGAVSFLNCRLGSVSLPGVEFTGSLGMVGCRFTAGARFIGAAFHGGANFSACVFSEKVFFRMARASKPVSLYHATFKQGADLSGAMFDDLSLSDVAVPAGSVTLYRSEIKGTLRWMVTLQREPQPQGSEWELSATRIGYLILSAGERQNSAEYTGPALWTVDSNVYLRNAAVDRLEFYNVRLAGDLDLSGATLRTLERNNAAFARVLGGWPPQSEYYSCFISYSARDADFAEWLYARLRENGVMCWSAQHDMPIGAVMRQQIYDAIGAYDRFLLVLSEHSIRSGWVHDEVEKCFELESRQKRDVLFPIRLDAEIERTNTAWAEKIRQQRNIGDFTQWDDTTSHESAFQRLLRDLKAPA